MQLASQQQQQQQPIPARLKAGSCLLFAGLAWQTDHRRHHQQQHSRAADNADTAARPHHDSQKPACSNHEAVQAASAAHTAI
jgi:hypothetical protein